MLEKKLADEPSDITSRTQLLGYYQKRRLDRDESALAEIRRHVLWLVRNSPETPVLGSPGGTIIRSADPEGYSEGEKAWMNQLEGDPDNVTLLGHAARFLHFSERKTRIELLQRARSLDSSNPEWPERLGREYETNIFRGSEPIGKESAEKALEMYETAFELSNERERETLLEDLAKVAFAAGRHGKARQYAESLLQGASAGMSWNYGNRVHHGNLVLGRIALAEGNAKAAKFRLIAAANTKGSPGLQSFGPNMTLARDFLERGEQDVVLKYFRLCSRFWENDRGRLDEWTAQVKEGKIPDFGANLAY
ncbi:MAG: RNA polymerase subunit sigma-24 [Acidobacteriota bacterium]|nr:RNA polymerase subunit sigma-24 [Acidobacteriota bacterium]